MACLLVVETLMNKASEGGISALQLEDPSKFISEILITTIIHGLLMGFVAYCTPKRSA